jgi:hypothetical protein
MATTKRSSEGGRKSTASRSRSTAAKSTSAKKGATKSKAQAAPKPRTSRSRAKTTGTTSTSGASRTQSRSSSRGTAQSRNGSGRSTTARSGSNGNSRSTSSSRSTGSSRNGTRAGAAAQTPEHVVGKLRQTGTAVRHAADKAGRPTITVAAAVAGIAGGLALRQRPRSGPDSVAARSMAMLHDVDPAALLGGLGKATVELSQRGRVVARDIERVAAQAERLGKIIS